MGDIMVLSFGTTVLGVIRALFSYIDAVVYWALVQIYNLFTDISRVDLFGSDGVGEFGTRIYTIIGVIMLFKLAFSILTYIIDPDKMSDNKNGFGSIIKNIVIMFVLIVAVPMIFRVSMGLQYLVLSDDTIGRLITGHSGGNYDSLGEKMSVMVLSTFVHPNEEYYSDCNGVITSTDANYDQCVSSLPADVKTEYRAVYEDEEHGRKNILKLARNTTKVSGYDDEFAITYHFILSPLVGIAISYIFLLFCIDVGVRTVKLAFLQLIAPIPIVTYIDNQGQGIFKKWVKTSTGTYADLFIRLAGIDFAIYLISEYIYGSELSICDWAIDGTRLYAHNCETPNIFVRLFLILGTLVFAKELPKLVEEITGLKLGGKFEMNPMKKFTGGGAGALLGLAGGGLAGAISARQAALATGNKHVLGNTLRGLATGSWNGARTGWGSDGTDSWNKIRTAANGSANSIYRNVGTTFFGKNGRLVTRAQMGLGMRTTAQKVDERNKLLKDIADYKTKLKNQSDFDTTTINDNNFMNQYGLDPAKAWNTKNLKQRYDDMVASGTATTQEITSAREAWEEAQKRSITGGNTAEIRALKDNLAAIINDNASALSGIAAGPNGGTIVGVSSTSTYDQINDAVIASQNEQVKNVNDANYRSSQRAMEAVNPNSGNKK